MTAYERGCATRDGFAADFERRTGKSWYAHISKGRPRRRRYIRKEQGLGAPPEPLKLIPNERRAGNMAGYGAREHD